VVLFETNNAMRFDQRGHALRGHPWTIPPTPDGKAPHLHGEDDREVVIVNIFARGKDHKLETLVMLPVSLRRNVLPLFRF
jgi:hypothetical protein